MKFPVLFDLSPLKQDPPEYNVKANGDVEMRVTIPELKFRNTIAIGVGGFIVSKIDNTLVRSLDRNMSKYLGRVYGSKR